MALKQSIRPSVSQADQCASRRDSGAAELYHREGTRSRLTGHEDPSHGHRLASPRFEGTSSFQLRHRCSGTRAATRTPAISRWEAGTDLQLVPRVGDETRAFLFTTCCEIQKNQRLGLFYFGAEDGSRIAGVDQFGMNLGAARARGDRPPY